MYGRDDVAAWAFAASSVSVRAWRLLWWWLSWFRVAIDFPNVVVRGSCRPVRQPVSGRWQ